VTGTVSTVTGTASTVTGTVSTVTGAGAAASSGFWTGSAPRSGCVVAKPSLQVDGGQPPPAADEPELDQAAGGPAVAPALEPELEQPPALWERDTVRTIVALPFMAAHLFARRRGPADAWMPDEDELDLMAGPLLNMANRYTVTRSLARFGDPVAFAAALGTYTTAESRRIARWRLEHAETAPMPDQDLDGLHVAASEPAGTGFRPWRPPVVADES
jgi:hypothetical protein